ncbi:MAG: hypothetical protein RR053_07025 [Evtepia sp.]
MTISEKVAYLKGLADGLDLGKDQTKEGKLISVVIEVLEEIGLSLEDLEDTTGALGEEIDALSEDLEDVEDVVFDDDDDDCDCNCGCNCDCDYDDDDDDDEDFFQIECPNCKEELVIDEDVLDAGQIKCPNCGEKFSLDFKDEKDTEDKE